MVLVAAILCFAGDLQPPPGTPKKPVTDEYVGGVKVVDDYRWLEAAASPEVREWSNQQNERTRAYLDSVPLRPGIVESLNRLENSPSTAFGGLVDRGGVLFAMEMQPPKPQPFLVTLHSPDDPASARAISDPNTIDPSGATAIDFFVPSLDGKLVAVSMSKNGTEDGTLSLFEVATGKQLADLIPRVNGATAGGSVAWNKDSTGFWYTRYPRPAERPEADLNFYQQVYFHRLGKLAAEDEYALGKEFPRIAETSLQTSEDGRFVLARVANGDGGEYLHYMRTADGRWHQITRLSDQTSDAAFGSDGSLYLLSTKDAPMGKILELSPPNFTIATAKTVVTPGRSAVDGFLPAGPHLYVRYMGGGPSKLLDKDGAKTERTIDILPISSVDQMVRSSGDQLLFQIESFLQPAAWHRYDPSTGGTRKTALAQTPPADFSDIEAIRQVAFSKDGTHVPMTILRRKGTKLDGNNPTLLYGYGGFNVSLSPWFAADRRLWFDHGGVWVIANLRGGGEFGETWHEQGQLAKKQNVFDDFIACAEYLIKSKYTSPEKLAIRGESNGGLLMGAVMTQRPDLFRAVIAAVGLYDMLRYENFPNGVFNVTEYGSVKERDTFPALYAYSPYQHVKDGTDYPAVLFMTGDNDGRVNPMNSRKMTARMQAATHSDRPILLRTSSGAGHGIGTALNKQIEEDADAFAFLFDQLGMK